MVYFGYFQSILVFWNKMELLLGNLIQISYNKSIPHPKKGSEVFSSQGVLPVSSLIIRAVYVCA